MGGAAGIAPCWIRHIGAGDPGPARTIRRQGGRAEIFATSSRFSKERLWHIELAVAWPVSGPMLIGDGYLGLGLMAPVRRIEGVFALGIADGLTDQTEPLELARALRRAVMARVQDTVGKRTTLPPFFTGHAPSGAPLRSGRHEHLAFVLDAPRKRLLIIAPHIIERREAQKANAKIFLRSKTRLVIFGNCVLVPEEGFRSPVVHFVSMRAIADRQPIP
jgi:CRISPR-associated protein Csb2